MANLVDFGYWILLPEMKNKYEKTVFELFCISLHTSKFCLLIHFLGSSNWIPCFAFQCPMQLTFDGKVGWISYISQIKVKSSWSKMWKNFAASMSSFSLWFESQWVSMSLSMSLNECFNESQWVSFSLNKMSLNDSH